MSKFEILCSEMVSYRVIVEAVNEDEAIEMVYNGQAPLGEPVEGDNFEIDQVLEIAE